MKSKSKSEIEVLEPLLLMSASGVDVNIADFNPAEIQATDANEAVIDGGSGNDLLVATGGTNVLQGGDGDDVLMSLGGANFMLGGDGNDTAAYSGNQSDYEIEDHGFGILAVTSESGKDFLTGVESIQFKDATVNVAEFLAGGANENTSADTSVPAASLAPERLEQAPELVFELDPVEPDVSAIPDNAPTAPTPLDGDAAVSSTPPTVETGQSSSASQNSESIEVSTSTESTVTTQQSTRTESSFSEITFAETTVAAAESVVYAASQMQSSDVNDAPEANNECVKLEIETTERVVKTERETIELTETVSETIELKVMEGSGKVFDFNATSSVLTEDVWFLENDAPVAQDEFQATTADDSRNDEFSQLNLLSNDADQFGNDLRISSVGGSQDNIGKWVAGSNGGAFFINADGSFNFSAEGEFDNLGNGESAQTELEYLVDDGLGGTDTAKIVIRIDGEQNTCPICVTEQKFIVEYAYNDGEGREITVDLSDSIRDTDGDNLTYQLNFADSYQLEGTKGKPGFFGWKVNSFDADTGELKLQVYTEQRDNWQYDAYKISDIFVGGRNAYTPFSFTATDESGMSVDCQFGLRVQDVDYDSPVALDLNNDGQIGVTGETTSIDKSGVSEIGRTVEFDIDNDGSKDTIEWFSGDGDGILIDNRDGNAANDMDGGRLFGDEGGKYSNGYEKLAALDADDNGLLESDELDGLEVWVDDGDATVESGEFRKLQDLGIFRISTNMTITTDAQGRDLMQSSASMELEATQSVEYSLSGTDASLFEINRTTGEVCFISSPDYEQPLDSDGDNVYELTLERVVNGQAISQTIEIAVCDKVATTTIGQTAVASGNVLANDTDANGDTLTATLVSGTQNGSLVLNSDGSYEYTPNDGFTGVDTFTYQVSDGNGGYDTAEVCIDVVPDDGTDNNSPVAGKDFNSTQKDVSVSGNVSTNDFDADGDNLTFSLRKSALNGVVALASDGSYTYTPNAGFAGTDTFCYQVEDCNGAIDVVEVCIEVNESTNVIDATDDAYSTKINNDVSGNVLDNDVDPEGDQLLVTEMTDVRTSAGGTVTLSSDGSFVFQPASGFVGVDSFVYESSDSAGNVTTANVTINVEALTDLPVDDSYTAETGQEINGDVTVNDTINNQGLSVRLIDGPANGSLTLNSDGTFRYTANDGFSGADSFQYVLACGDATTEAATVSLITTDVQYDTTYSGSGADGLIWGDPHFRGDDGGFYDVQGEAGRVYNLLSDSDLQLNARFIFWQGEVADGTVLGELGLTMGNDQLQVDLDGAQLNGNDLEIGTTQTVKGSVTYDGTVTTVDSGDYILTMTRQDGMFALRIKVVDPFSDYVAPHGLWGQTVDADSEARNGDFYKDNYDYGLQGGGALDKVDADGSIVRSERGDMTAYQLYETAGLFSTDALYAEGSQFFRFGAERGTGLTRL